MIVDPHTHTSIGSRDSRISPRELLSKALKRGVNVICITDHDNYGGFEEAQKIGEKEGIIVIRGLELSTHYGHLLIYGTDIFDICKIDKNILLEKFSVHRKEYFTISEVKNIISDSFSSLFEINELIKKVHQYGGAVVLPHPFSRYNGSITIRYYLEEYLKSNSLKEVKIDKLLSFVEDKDPEYFSILQEIDGIEVLNASCFGVENNAAFILADFLNKAPIGASDCHTPEQVGVYVTEFPKIIKTERDFISQLKIGKTKPKLNFVEDNLGSLDLR